MSYSLKKVITQMNCLKMNTNKKYYNKVEQTEIKHHRT